MKAKAVVASALVVLFAGVARAETYKVDPVHSSIITSVLHFGAANLYGRFTNASGSFALDANDPSKDSIEVTVPTNTFDTANAKRDEHVKGPDFLAAKQFPTITFKSTSFTQTSTDVYDVTGDLTLHGVTKPITVKLQKTGEGKNPMNGTKVAGLETQFDINRSEFGIKGMPGGVGEKVHLIVSLEGDAK